MTGQRQGRLAIDHFCSQGVLYALYKDRLSILALAQPTYPRTCHKYTAAMHFTHASVHIGKRAGCRVDAHSGMQAKVLEAAAGQREAARQLQEARQASDSERAHLEQLVRRSKEEGAVRIQTLEDTIRKLGNRSDLHQVGCLTRFCCRVGFLWPATALQLHTTACLLLLHHEGRLCMGDIT